MNVRASKEMLNLLLVMLLGFLGSFGHCIGMCGPLTVALSLADASTTTSSVWKSLWFHGLLNLGRIFSYTLVGAGIGGLGSIFIVGGQLAGIDSLLRQSLAVVTGGWLIWMGLAQVQPQLLPKIPLLHPFLQTGLHQRLNTVMVRYTDRSHWLTPLLLGAIWGLIPCGFLYAAQIKAAATGDLRQGAATMLAFGLGTLPSMLGVGVSATMMSADRRSQLSRLGGWVMLTIGILTLLRTGDMMSDFTGHGSLLCLMLALVARPISRIWSAPLTYRRGLGVGAFILACAHTLHMTEHTLGWNLDAVAFMLPEQQWALWAGLGALILMLPAACTSYDRLMVAMGSYWRSLHLLAIPALILAGCHAIVLGSHYLGALDAAWNHRLSTILLVLMLLGVLGIRLRWVWSLLSLEKFYAPVLKPHHNSR